MAATQSHKKSALVLEVKSKSKDGFETEVEWVPVFQSAAKKKDRAGDSEKKSAKAVENPKGPYQALIGKLADSGAFTGGYKSSQFIRFAGHEGAEHIYLGGCGAASDLTEERARVLGGLAYLKLATEKVRALSIAVDALPGSGKKARLAAAFAEGLVLRAYEFRKYKTKGESESKLEKITFVTADAKAKKELQSTATYLEALLECVQITRDWSNEPSNEGTPEYFAEQCKKIAQANGIKCKILDEKACADEKMRLFLSVGQGSDRESRVVILEYTPKQASKKVKTVALVGKGVTFDTGGISIKPSLKMEDMKHDMTGAATLFGATVLAAKLKANVKIVTVLAFTENMPSGHAIKPGDIVTSRNGKTVEINNTDAEGRLVLADALDLAQDYQPDFMIDAATLTGAVQVALGKYCCGVLGNDDRFIRQLQAIGEETGERMWQLPLFDEYFDDMKSEYADMRNVANDPNGGTIRGAIFLKQFVKKEVKWAHLDIAATAWDMGQFAYYPRRGASGAYVRTVAEFLRSF